MELEQQFAAFIREEHLFAPNDRLLIAVSGGVDSVVLCQLAGKAGFSFSIAHINFQLRGAESDADAAFVASLAQQYGVPFFSKAIDTVTYAEAHQLNIQAAARAIRYEWLLGLLAPDKKATSGDAPQWLLTAHQQDDVVETMLMNFFKGTGIRGLHGILPKKDRIIRPLLFAQKSELLEYAKKNQLTWREDSSNASDKYSRNYWRHQLLPAIQQLYPQAAENLAANSQRFRETEMLFVERIQQLKKKYWVRGTQGHWQFPVIPLTQMPYVETILFEWLSPVGFSPDQAAAAVQLLTASTGKQVVSDTHRLIRNRKWLLLVPVDTVEAGPVVIEGTGDWSFPEGMLQVRTATDTEINWSDNPLRVTLDAKKLAFPLLLRLWKSGDYFYPLGMQKKKKVARFLIDSKLSRPEKERQWVLETQQKIPWVIGRRIDDRFKVTGQTKEILSLHWIPKN